MPGAKKHKRLQALIPALLCDFVFFCVLDACFSSFPENRVWHTLCFQGSLAAIAYFLAETPHVARMGKWEGCAFFMGAVIAMLYRSAIGYTSVRVPLLQMVYYACLPAICEEWLFRGAIGPYVCGRYGKIAGWMLTSFLFALMHVSLEDFLPLLCLGLACGWSVQKTNAITGACLAHVSYNLVMLIPFP